MDHSFAKEVENGVASAHEALPLISRGDASPGSLGGGRGSSLRRPALFLASLLAVAGVFLVGFDVGIARGKEYYNLDATEDLHLDLVNEYGSQNLTSYPFLADDSYGVLVEPYKATEIRVGNPKEWAVYTFSVGSVPKASLKVAELSPTVEEHVNVHAVTITRTVTGVYSLRVTEKVKGAVTREKSVNMYVKYVRRELRTLSDRDREAFLDAAITLWKTSTRVGREELNYGPRYRDINSLAIIHNDLAGNVICDHLHGTNGYMFVTGHVALNNMLEQSIQAVDPSVSLPYWEYAREADTCKVGESACFWDIWDSEIFSSKFFGAKSTTGGGEIADGRWANIQVPELNDAFFEEAMIEGHYREHSYAGCFGQSSDPDENSGCDMVEVRNFLKKAAGPRSTGGTNFTKWADKHVENAFGLLRSPWNLNADRHVLRFGNMCGVKNDQQWPTCDSIIVQQATYDSFADWVLQVQFSPHGSVHTFIGGASGGCTDREELKTVLSYATFHRIIEKSADLLKDLYWENDIKMPSRDECAGLPEAECTMSCPGLDGLNSDTVTNADFETMDTYQYLLEYMSPDMKKELHALAPELKFMVVQHLCDDTTLLGDMLTSNSPLDVSFFHVHAEVERIFQRKALSGTFKDTTWPSCVAMNGGARDTCPGWCPGYKLKWFDYSFDGVHPDTTASTALSVSSDYDSSEEDAASAASDNTVEAEYSYSRNVRNDELLSHLTPSTEHYARMVPYVYDEFVWRGCEIPKKYKSYVDLSLMNATQWVKAEKIEWLQKTLSED